MKTIFNPGINRNDLLNLISKGQEVIELLKSIISIEDLQNVTFANLLPAAESRLTPEALLILEKKVSQLKVAFENDSTILIKLPGKLAVEYSCRQMGFRSQETKTWKILMEILSSAPHTFNFGIAYFYPDGSKKYRQKSKEYDAGWKLFDELNKKLLTFFNREFNWTFPEGYKLYKNAVTGSDGEKCFKFFVEPPSSQTATPALSSKGEAVSLNEIEKRFLSFDENKLVKEIRTLNDDFSVDSWVHNDPPEYLIAALNVGKNKFGWADEKVREIILY
ncbi:MAG: hypothetical protein O3C58_12250 [Nitrospinae bacterium]|jgi:hypothetical protein|nr:hypothetical protein [Nitrospinota bacterium]